MSVFAELHPPYSTIVADPPWPYADGPMQRQRQSGKASFLPYSPMGLAELADLPVAGLAAIDAHLWLWTTQRFLWDAKPLAESWGFTVGPVVTWCKTPMGTTPSTEYLILCRRRFGDAIRTARTAAGLTLAELHRAIRGGSPTGLVGMWESSDRYPNPADWERLRKVLGDDLPTVGHPCALTSTWYSWPRGSHSEKPAAAGDLIEASSPGPYVELFARAPRLGWDSWGKGYEGAA